MGNDGAMDTEVVEAAQAGDGAARDRLVADCLPLVYNIVGRAMNGHPDVDDVVQETMIRMVGGLSGLRDTTAFRSWLVAVAMNEVRRSRNARQAGPVPDIDGMAQVADPAGDFVDLTVLRLGLSGQRREVTEATRWLDDRDRDLLSLWWLEAAGRLTRTELAEALELSPQHTAVRVQRMKEQLEVGRTVVRALSAEPRCPSLGELTTAWDGRPSALWRKRIARHLRTCRICEGTARGLVPAEGLLAGLVLVVPMHGFSLGPEFFAAKLAALPGPGTAVTSVLTHTGSAGSAAVPPAPSGAGDRVLDLIGPRGTRSLRRAARRRARRALQAAGAVAVTAAVLGVVRGLPDDTVPPPPPAPSVSVPGPRTVALDAPAPSPSPTTAPPSPSPSPSASPSPTPRSPERQLVDLINAERAKRGCRALRVDAKLHTAAQRHSEDMSARRYFDHDDPAGRGPESRIDAAGYRWRAWGENIDQRRKSPADVFDDWMDDDYHQQNMLDCRYLDAGVGTAPDPAGGLLWTLDVGTPA
ncbi:sigma-70 family RNA polymerase sigma factor [Kitasatospora sp. NPDC085895]|uniref:sigma-70 family RNA polymerase sigma factor n=1 Tax=Kitasatospora sp. NPDC085895 TaxID=3155057 RepID=UPI00345043B7